MTTTNSTPKVRDVAKDLLESIADTMDRLSNEQFFEDEHELGMEVIERIKDWMASRELCYCCRQESRYCICQ